MEAFISNFKLFDHLYWYILLLTVNVWGVNALLLSLSCIFRHECVIDGINYTKCVVDAYDYELVRDLLLIRLFL